MGAMMGAVDHGHAVRGTWFGFASRLDLAYTFLLLDSNSNSFECTWPPPAFDPRLGTLGASCTPAVRYIFSRPEGDTNTSHTRTHTDTGDIPRAPRERARPRRRPRKRPRCYYVGRQPFTPPAANKYADTSDILQSGWQRSSRIMRIVN